MDARRVARLDLADVDPRDAVEWIAEAAGMIAGETRRFRAAALCGVGYDLDDLRAIAQVAVLEARLTYKEDSKASIATWTRRCIRWRLTETVTKAPSREADVEDRLLVEAETPENRAAAQEMAAWFRDAVGNLSPRQRTMVYGRLRQETQRATARTLGISDARASQEMRAALNSLRDAALDEGLVSS